MVTIAFFISPHGFGHAARASAVMQALTRRIPQILFEIFTTAPAWFFRESLSCPFNYHHEIVDIGLVQATPLAEDLPATLSALESFIPFSTNLLDRLATCLRQTNCSLVICDISPLGLAVARHANIPSILIENFTWDWIYAGYLELHPSFERFISLFKQHFASCSCHIQTHPLCSHSLNADFISPPISRDPLASAVETRDKLGIPLDQPVLLLTMGGIQADFSTVKASTKNAQSPLIIIPGGSQVLERDGNLILLPHHSPFYHPDLINAVDAVISKIGYSTIAEAYFAGTPFGYIPRLSFRESPMLEKFIERYIPCLSFTENDFVSPLLTEKITRLMSLAPRKPAAKNGASLVAEFIHHRFLPKVMD